jgi:hypothetical protein
MSWLENLKSGDTVIVSSHYYSNVKTIEKVTPTGRVKIGSTYYDKSGRSIGDHRWDCGSYLKEATPEAVEDIRQKEVISKAFNAMRNNFKELTYKQSLEILAILGQTEE